MAGDLVVFWSKQASNRGFTMHRTLSALALAGLLAGFGSAQAADFEPEREIGLIVSGVADNWIGAQFMSGPVEEGQPGDTTDEIE